jgi:hypothetical protein
VYVVWAAVATLERSIEMFMVIGTQSSNLMMMSFICSSTLYTHVVPPCYTAVDTVLQNVFSINDKNKTPRSNVAPSRFECFLRDSLQNVFSI